MTETTDPTAYIEVLARLLCAADVHVHGDDHPTWQQLVGEPGRRIRDDYRKAARWLAARLTVTSASPAVSVAAPPAVDPMAAASNAVFEEGDQLAETLEAAFWAHCKTDDRRITDDPRTIAAVAAAVARTMQAAPADRVDVLREAADICDEAGALYAGKALNDHADGAFRLMERFLRKANEAEYVATPCSVPNVCEDGGEPCSTHERLMAHGEGDHELCAPDCGEQPAVVSEPGKEA